MIQNLFRKSLLFSIFGGNHELQRHGIQSPSSLHMAREVGILCGERHLIIPPIHKITGKALVEPKKVYKSIDMSLGHFPRRLLRR